MCFENRSISSNTLIYPQRGYMPASHRGTIDALSNDEANGSNRGEVIMEDIKEGVEPGVLDDAINAAAPAGAPMTRTPEEEFLASILAGRDLSDLVDPAEEAAAEEARIAAMTDAAREAHFEHEALATVFDDIRERSQGGELTTPDYWETVGLAPEHMDAPAFTALVFDTIIDAQAQSAERREALEAAKAAAAAVPDEAPEPAAAAPEASASEEASAPADEAATDEAPAADEAAASADAADAEAPAEPEAPADEPEAPVWELDDIAVLEGSQVYLYSTDHMSDSFARWAFLAAENDDVATLVENARTESKIYPRPLKASSLKNRPVFMTDERIDAAFATAQESGLYPDIKTCSASNGDVYFYSTDYLSDAQAKALAEWESVERRANM